MAVAETQNPCLGALAERHPLLLQDISEWVRAHPESTRLGSQPPRPAFLRQDGHDVLVDLMPSDQVLDHLRVDQGRPLVHVFPQLARCLQFLGQPDALGCVQNENWVPLLLFPLESAAHTQRWLAKTNPKRWPWQFLNGNGFDDPDAALEAKSLGLQMAALLRQMCLALNETLELKYTDQRPTSGQILKAADRPLRALVFAGEGSAYQQFCARDITDALVANGVDAQIRLASASPAIFHELLEAVQDFDPDVLILNGRSRNQLHALPRNLTVVAWDQDYAISCSPAYAPHAGPRDLLLVMVADWLEHARAFGVPPKRVAHLNLGTNTRIYHPPAASEIIEPEFDILFVGNIYPFESYKKLIHFDQLNIPTQQVMTYARKRLIDWAGSRKEDQPWVLPDCRVFLNDCLRELGIGLAEDPARWQFLVHYFRYRIAHLALRELYVSALSEFKLGLFGRGWDQFPAVAAQARPEIVNGPDLCDVIYKSRINLHLHTWTVHHPRLYDTAAAGGFLLVGRVQEQYPLENVFTPGKELDTFGSIAELKQKIRHYLDHPTERAEMARRAAMRAEQQHTMQQRMGDVIELLRKDSDGSDKA